ncbi:NADPH2:quinone reductase [Fusarium beomiforme]|uniref:NADPH2:quinone reductase n=1 Tax=Fusarium beomiforme TaxID=44412 RepID=A0A9P5AWR4_9HYPO|nr:NADPH2:quinone reductase [Fusarium beomiforme]
MKAVGVAKYGPVENLESRVVPRPSRPTGRDIIVKLNLNFSLQLHTNCGEDYYNFAPKDFHIIGYDGAGIVSEVGPECSLFKPGDEVSYVGASTRQGSYAEYQLVNELHCASKPKSLDFVQAASFGLTFGTAYQSLYHRLEIKPNENVGILIINGAGGVGSAAIQLARHVSNLPVVVATASRPETIDYCKKLGATHVINHRKNLVEQVKALNLGVGIKYAYILASTEQYVDAVAKICMPFGKACTIVQADISLYGTDFMSKSMTFAWDWLGSAAYHQTNVEGYHEIFTTLSHLMDEKKIVPTLGKRYKLSLAGLKEAHKQIESKTTIGKIGLGINEPGEGDAFS